MKLYFNGCSHTYGDDLFDKSVAWPSVVARHYNCEFLNDSVSGGTNDRIVYRTLKHADQFDYFCIAWTYITRFTRYRNDNNYEVNFNSSLTNTLYGKTTEFQQYGKLHYTVWYNELFAFKIWLQTIILLQRFFQSINKPYIMINADHNNINRWTVGCNEFNNSVKSLLCFDLMNDEQLIAEHNEIQQLIAQIDFTYYPGWNDWWITKKHTEYPVGTSGHLLEEGHQAIAQYIIEHANV